MNSENVLAIDMGGSKISAALLSVDYKIARQSIYDTPKNANLVSKKIKEIVRETAPDSKLIGIGIGVAGMVNPQTEKILEAPNLKVPANLKEKLEAETNLPCKIDNDANLALFGELLAGSGRDKQNFIGLTLGTGIGGGIIADRQLRRGTSGSAAEFGHMILKLDGDQCGCGNKGCFETLASGTAIERLGKQIVTQNPNSTLAKTVSADPDRITGKLIVGEARRGDKNCLAIMAEIGLWLGIGIGNLINAFDPEIVIVGGGLSSSMDMLITTASEQIERIVVGPAARKTPIIASKLDNKAGLIGAAGLIFEEI